MPQQEFEGKDYQEGVSERGRAFLEALARRKRARGEELPPLYRVLLEGGPGAPAEPLKDPGQAPAPRPGEALRSLKLSPSGLTRPTPEELRRTPPRPTLAPPDPEAEAERMLQAHPEALEDLPERERRVYRLLLVLGLAHHFRHTPRVPRALVGVVAFAPAEALALAAGVSLATLYRALGGLEARGLVLRRAWRARATLRGRTGVYAAGTVFAVRLPGREGRLKLLREDLEHPWRDLEGDVEAKRTAWNLVRESKEKPPKGGLGLRAREFLLSFPLSPLAKQNPPLDIDSLTALLRAKPRARRAGVEALARALAEEFCDPGSVRFYAHVLWSALRMELYGMSRDALKTVAWALGRTRAAVHTTLYSPRKRRIQRPGALFARLLDEGGFLPLARNLPQWRVA
ncbi:hypothetical protein [Thermus oshimai]